jgi:hypothetical protein
MNVTNTWMNNTHESGIVYTVGGVNGIGAHGGFVGDHPSWTHRAAYDSVSVDYCSGDITAMGIRLSNSDNITFNHVNIQDAHTDGLWVEYCDNLVANATVCYYNTNAADDYNIYLHNSTNCIFTNCTAYSPDGAADGGNWYLTGSYQNNFTSCIAFGSTDHEDYYVDATSHNNTFTNCTGNNSNIGFEIEGVYNNFYDCHAYAETASGFRLTEASSHNSLNRCIGDASNLRGISVSGFDANNNSIENSTFSGHSFGVYMWPTADSNCADNYFWYCTISNNTQTGVDIGRTPLNYFYECDVFDNTNYGFEIKTNSSTYIYNCDVYNPESSRTYDFYIDNTSSVDIYGKYILGYDKNINFQFDTVQPYGLAAHDSGDGLWTLNTTAMTVKCNDEKDVYVNLTDWTGATYRKWYVTGQSGDYLYQKIGGLTAGTLYNLKVNGVSQGTYNAQTETMLRTSSGVAWFNYTGGWSTLYFEITPYVAGDDDDDDAAGGGGSSDTTDDTTTPSVAPPTAGTDLFVYVAIATIIIILGGVLFYYWYTKK